MAAYDLFEEITSHIPPSARPNLSEFVKSQREELFSARSEEARVRIVKEYMRKIHEMHVKAARSKS
jgi:hypothetical protein